MDINAMAEALIAAERFIAGFEGDEMQEGIDGLLAQVRAAIPQASNRPGDAAAILAEETGMDYSAALVACNMD